ncbi:MAG: hypothetical protein NPIRA02_42490 [Nitrospirales bacterium]|nr:MAG: hypothetical protein NPIRA02_42490 [Nitrospirales bacterium]
MEWGRRFILLGLMITTTTGCGLYGESLKPVTLGEQASGFAYIPIDPSKVEIEIGECKIDYAAISANNLNFLSMLPDNAVRMSMELANQMGKVSYGVSNAEVAGTGYKLTADYVNSDTVSKTVWIRRTVLVETIEYKGDKRHTSTKRQAVSLRQGSINSSDTDGGGFFSWLLQRKSGFIKQSIPGSDLFEVSRKKGRPANTLNQSAEEEYWEEFSVPIYVGIGLRIVAEGKTLSGDANISGIGIIGAEAEAKRLSGSLTVQTLGVNSQAVASALPVQSELSRTTAENAFVAIGAIKAMLHQPKTIIFPRVVGLYLPFPGGKPLVNALIAELSRDPVKWCPTGFDRS